MSTPTPAPEPVPRRDVCPACASDGITEDAPFFPAHTNTVITDAWCVECHATWENVYALHHRQRLRTDPQED